MLASLSFLLLFFATSFFEDPADASLASERFLVLSPFLLLLFFFLPTDDDEEEEEEEEDSGEYEKDGKVFSADGTELYSVEDRESYFAQMETDD